MELISRNTIKILTFFLIIIALSSFTLGVAIGVSPSVLNYNEVLKNGYALKTLLLSTDTPNDLTISIERSGEVAEWISFEPIDLRISNITINDKNPYLLSVIVQPPSDVQNGNYTGYIRVITDKIENVETGKGASVKAAFMVNVRVEIVGKEIVRCIAGGLHISSFEIGEELKIDYIIENTGNVKINPDVFLDIFDNKNNKITSYDLRSDMILPTLKNNLENPVSNNLIERQYFATVNIPLCNEVKTLTFDVVEPGGIRDSGDLLSIEHASWSKTGEIIPITGVFKNTGPRSVRAKFIGTINDAKDKVVKIIDTDYITIGPGETQRFQSFFKPNSPGQYFVKGKINFNNKITFEKISVMNINIGEESSSSIGWGTIIFFSVVIVLLLIIIKKRKLLLRRKKHRPYHHKKKNKLKLKF